ncbi:MAG: DUF962 domain-containing protein [Gammaproteobacteria bacterium]|nr:DUF962 domain-containing protein [Gammaproteobacteria bacterium]
MNYPKNNLKQYQAYHTQFITFVTHFFGIPLLFIALQIMISLGFYRSLFFFPLHWLGLCFLIPVYFSYSILFGSVTLIYLSLLTYVATYLSVNFPSPCFLCFTFFLAGVLLQVYGHQCEGNKPALLDNLAYVFIAPLFLMVEIPSRLKESLKNLKKS